MPSKTVKKITPSSEPVVEKVTTEPVVQTSVTETPVIEKVPTESQELASSIKQKGGKKNAKTIIPVVESAPAVVETTLAPVVDSTPVVESAPTGAKKGGKAKASKVVDASTPVVETIPKTNKKVSKAAKVTEQVADDQTGGKPKVIKKQLVKKAKILNPVVETGVPTEQTESTEISERLVRSFKVKLPLKEEFEGRFTGLTPYQAANKALSKYFRETENPKQEITFLICESTRKSKKSVYTYVGKRYQLEVPVKYTIQDGREIVKNFKNSLKKVKKVDLLNEQAAGAAVVPVVAA